MSPQTVVNGNSSCLIQFFRRTSIGSSPTSMASSSMIRSIAYVASGRPAPRYASVNVVFVNTPVHSNR